MQYYENKYPYMSIDSCPGRMPDPYMMPPNQHMMPPSDPYTYPQNLPMALQLISEAVAGEMEDRLFYDYLLKNAPSAEDKDIIAGIRDDEIKHFRLFREIYYEITGKMLSHPPASDFTPPTSYCEGVKKALFGELAAVEKYRKILYAMRNRVHINKMTEIITDEQKHATKWNYLYTKNECFEEEKKG